MGLWEDFVGWLTGLWYGFWDIVKDVLTFCWNIVETIVLKIIPAALVAIGVVTGAVVTLAIFSPIAATALVNAVVGFTAGIVSLAAKVAVGTFETAIAAIDIMYHGVATIVDAINLDALLEVHEVLWLLSAEYRSLVSQLFEKISEVSEALFGHTMVLSLIFENTRSIFMSSWALLGGSYDGGQLEWLLQLNDIMVKFNEKAQTYMEAPDELFYDLAEWADKNAIDVAGSRMKADRSAFLLNLDLLKATMLKLDTTSKAFAKFEHDLPEQRRRDIDFRINPINLRLGAFQFSSYERHRLETGYMVKDNREGLERNRRTLQGIQWGTDRPSRGFEKIEGLPEDERIKEEEIIEDYSSRELGRDNEELVNQHDERIEQEDKEKVREELTLPPPSWEAITEKEVKTLSMEKSQRRDSPFVGDY